MYTQIDVFVIFRAETQAAASQGITGETQQSSKSESIMCPFCCLPELSFNFSAKTFVSVIQSTIWTVNPRWLAQEEILLTGQWSKSWKLNWKFTC